MYRIIILLSVAMLLSACGQYGPLYLVNGQTQVHKTTDKEVKPIAEPPQADNSNL